MVRLNRIYTKTGDSGTTGLGDGSRLPKHHLRIRAYGSVDELSSVLGLMRAHGLEEPYQGWILTIQNDLFDVGADLCVPGDAGEKLRLTPKYTERLEGWLDQVNEDLEPLTTFVLPGGCMAAAWMHMARTTCRRVERNVSELMALPDQEVNQEVLKYLNRLSDLLFVFSRALNDGGKSDVLWKPGANG